VGASALFSGGLFTRDWLSEGVVEAPEWQALDQNDVAARVEEARQLLSALAAQTNPNEAETEQRLIFPMLRLLGWEHIAVQQNMTVRGRSDVPDALLFPDQSSHDAAMQREPWARFELGACLVEAKRWSRPLDREGGRGDPLVPSTQLLHYLRRADDVSAGRMRWGLLTNGRLWRLYWQGALSIAEDYLEIDLMKAAGLAEPDLLDRDCPDPVHVFRLFLLLYGRSAFVASAGGTTLHDRALRAGRQWEARVAASLSGVVFEQVFPALVTAIASADQQQPADASTEYLEEVRSGALFLLYRLLFVLYAEDRNLLPDERGPYADYCLTRLRHEIAERRQQGGTYSPRMTTLWARVSEIFRAISEGDDHLGIPPYNGGLFSPSSAPILSRVGIPDSVMADVIFRLSHEDAQPRPRYINYRDLSVQQLGSIYEGILEYALERRDDGSIGPVADNQARHRSGSYYTPEELVSLIIDRAVGPIVAERLQAFVAKVDALADDPRPPVDCLLELEDLDPAARLLELKIVDPAMGSGHFLVSLVDWLSDRVLSAIGDASAALDRASWADDLAYSSPVLARIEDVRESILGHARTHGWPIVEDQLDDRHIIRRMVLKRCIYGVDLNPMAVELAKVALWLHSFTVGAPLSFLDHHLRCGNSLLGAWMRPAALTLSNRGSLYIGQRLAVIDQVAGLMDRIEANTDSDKDAVAESKATFGLVEEATEPLAAMLDLVTAEAASGVFAAAPRRPRETADEIARRGGSPTLVARARAAMVAFERAAALQSVLEGTLGDPFDLASGRAEIMSAEARQQLALLPAEAEVQGSLLPSVRPDDRRRAVAADLLDQLRRFATDHRLFHWELAFPGVWTDLTSEDRQGGFDAVIGNPPYVRQELLGSIKPALANAYRSFDGVADLYVYFYEQGLNLLRPGGRMSFVVTNKWLKAGYADKLRRLFAEDAWVEFVADFGHARHLFADADVMPCVICVRRPDTGPAPETFDLAVIPRDDVPQEALGRAVLSVQAPALRSQLSADAWTLEPPAIAALLDKLRRNGLPLVEAAGCRPLYGVKTGFNEAFLIDTQTRDRLVREDASAAEIIRPYLRGQDIDRWNPAWADLWMIFARRGIDIERYPSVLRHLDSYRAKLEPKPAGWQPMTPGEEWPGRKQGTYRWFEVQDPVDYWREFDQPKIMIRRIAFYSMFGLDRQNRWVNDSALILPTTDLAVLAALNSPILWLFQFRTFPHKKDEALAMDIPYVERLPIPSFSSEHRDGLTPQVEALIDLTRVIRDADQAVADWLLTVFGLPRLTRPLGNASLLNSDDFVAAVSSCFPRRRPVSSTELQRLRAEYNASVAPAREARIATIAHERAISDIVNAAYGLTPEDVALMWETAPPRMPIERPPGTPA